MKIIEFLKKFNNNGFAVLIFLLALLSFALMETTAKYLSTSYPVMQVVWARYIFHYLALIIFYIIFCFKVEFTEILKTNSIKLHVSRSCSLFLMTFCFFYSLSILPIADATAIVYVAPIIIVILSPFLLKEKMDILKWLSVSIGFIGMLVVLKPVSVYDMILDFSFNFEYLSAILAAIFASLFFALYQIGSRALALAGEKPITGVVYSGLIGVLFTSAYLLLDGLFSLKFISNTWYAPNIQGWLFLILAGFLGALGQFLTLIAFKYASATVLAPINYVHLIYAATLSILVFSEIPKISTVFGGLIIIISGVFAYKLSQCEEY